MEPAVKGRPYLLVQADVDTTHLRDFERWHREVHLEHVLEIPGVTAYRRFRASAPERYVALYEFEDEDAIHAALQSPQASRARDEWRPWLPHVNDLTVEVYAVLNPSPKRRHRN